MMGASDLLWGPSDAQSAGGVLRTHDGYFYLAHARDLLQRLAAGEVREVLRAPLISPTQAPWLSALAAWTSFITLAPVEWAGVVLPSILAVLLALPVYGIGKAHLGSLAGAIAATVAILQPNYFFRTTAGCFDTDVLNVALYAAIAWAFSRAVVGTCTRRAQCGLLGVGFVIMSYLIWPNAGHAHAVYGGAVAAACFAPPLLRGLKSRSPDRAVWLLLGLLALGVVIFGRNIAAVVAGPFRQLWFAWSPDAAGSRALLVAENLPVPVRMLAAQAPFDLLVLLASLATALSLFVFRPREFFFLLPMLGLGLLGLRSVRFLQFLAPMVGLGVGYWMSRALAGPARKPWLMLATVFWALLLVAGSLRHPPAPPVCSRAFALALKEWGSRLPAKACLWPHWNAGYAAQYYAERPSLFHGGSINDFNMDCNAVPFVSTSDVAAAGFMRFYSGQGEQKAHATIQWLAKRGVEPFEFLCDLLSRPRNEAERILAERFPGESSEKMRERFFPEAIRPVYLILDAEMLASMEFWLGPGTRPLRRLKMAETGIRRYRGLAFNGMGCADAAKQVAVDFNQGTLAEGEQGIWLDRVVRFGSQGVSQRRYGRLEAPVFFYIESEQEGLLLDDKVAGSLYVRLFLLGESAPSFRETQTNHSEFKAWGIEDGELSREEIARRARSGFSSAEKEPTGEVPSSWPAGPLREEFADLQSVVVMGDSIALGTYASPQAAFPNEFARQYGREWGCPPPRIHNRSFKGDRVRNALDRPWPIDLVAGADLIIIELGINDMADMASGRPTDDFLSEYAALLDRLKATATGPVVVLSPAPTPMQWELHFPDQERIVGLMQEETKKRGFYFADTHAVFRTALKTCWYSDLFVDGINHPTPRGHRLMAAALRETMSAPPSPSP